MPLLSIVSIMLKLGKERFNSFSLYLGWEKDISVSPPDFEHIFWQRFGFIYPSSGHNGKHGLIRQKNTWQNYMKRLLNRKMLTKW